MAIMEVDPLREFAMMQDRLNRLFGNVYLRDEDTGFRGNWAPSVDIYETERHDLVLRAELPGMTREDINITVENGTIVIKGEKKFDPEVKEEHYRRIERAYGTFHRSFTLPNTVAVANRIVNSVDLTPGANTVTLSGATFSWTTGQIVP